MGEFDTGQVDLLIQAVFAQQRPQVAGEHVELFQFLVVELYDLGDEFVVAHKAAQILLEHVQCVFVLADPFQRATNVFQLHGITRLFGFALIALRRLNGFYRFPVASTKPVHRRAGEIA